MWIDALLVFLILTNLMLLGSSRMGSCIRLVAVQGVVLGLLPLLILEHMQLSRALFLSLAAVGLKGVVFPWLLSRALREAGVRREVEPIVSYAMSLLFGLVALGLSFWLGAHLRLPSTMMGSLVIPSALFMILVGFFLIISRRKALNQVLGYLVLENGAYTLGLVLVGEINFLVELGVLLDVFVAVFVMGIAIYHMNREFDHIDVDRLDQLKG